MLRPLPEKPKRVVIGTTVRKPLVVLDAYLKTLAWQVLPPNVEVSYCFVPDFTPEQSDADQLLRTWTAERGGVVLRAAPGRTDDFSDAPGVTHVWTGSAMARVAEHKNRIIRHALECGADALFCVDADLLLEPFTLRSLWSVEQPIACAVYWTRWNKHPDIHAAPQVWLNHPYQLQGRGWDEPTFRRALIDRQLTQVWGQGACTLIRREVLERGVDFSLLPDLPKEGMWQGEDRHFCVTCERTHIPMFADPWPDIFHVYHQPEDIEKIPVMLARLSSRGEITQRFSGEGVPVGIVGSPRIGDLVSFTLQALEPIPQPNGHSLVAPQHIRGRLGQLALMPELEDAILGMKPGDDRIIPVHCDITHPIPQLRGSRRLIRVRFHDTKPHGFAPVVDEELFLSPRGGRALDHSALSHEQHDGIRELATR